MISILFLVTCITCTPSNSSVFDQNNEKLCVHMHSFYKLQTEEKQPQGNNYLGLYSMFLLKIKEQC
jgi:hypothetical protein